MGSGIYAIRNKVNGKVYVGSAVSIASRWAHHRASLRGGYHQNQILQRAWRKYGEAAFEFVVIEQVVNLDLLLEREQHYLDTLPTFTTKGGYNICPIAGNTRGRTASLETRAKISAVQKGRASYVRTADHKIAKSLQMKAVWELKRKPKPVRVCGNCSREYARGRLQRCNACYVFRSRHGTERPSNMVFNSKSHKTATT